MWLIEMLIKQCYVCIIYSSNKLLYVMLNNLLLHKVNSCTRLIRNFLVYIMSSSVYEKLFNLNI